MWTLNMGRRDELWRDAVPEDTLDGGVPGAGGHSWQDT